MIYIIIHCFCTVFAVFFWCFDLTQPRFSLTACFRVIQQLLMSFYELCVFPKDLVPSGSLQKIQQLHNVKMEISKPSRAPLSQKFIIKTKTSLAQNMRSENSDPELPTSLDGEVELFLQHMVVKSKRFKDLLVERKVDNGQQFCEKYLCQSVCLKTILKTVLDKMQMERRLGKNLKGLNKGNLTEIENLIWSSIIREIELYKNQQEYNRGKEDLQNVLAQRKNEIMEELSKLRAKGKGNQ